MDITPQLRAQVQEHNLCGYIKIVEATPHPNTMEVSMKVREDRLTNAHIREVLGLKNEGGRQIDVPEA